MCIKRKKKELPRIKRPRTITILSWLLMLEALVMLALGVYHFSLSQGPQILTDWFSELIGGRSPTLQSFFSQLAEKAAELGTETALFESAALFLLTIFTLLTSYGFFRLWRIAWAQAIFVQGSSLLIALLLYFQSKPLHIYLLMLMGVFMTGYLNYANVQAFFWMQKSEIVKGGDG